MNDDDKMREDLKGATLLDLQTLIADLSHAMQTGVKFTHEFETGEPIDKDLKDLRVGVNAAMVQVGALCALLTRAGVFSDHDWFVEYAVMMQREVEAYRDKIEKITGTRMHLG